MKTPKQTVTLNNLTAKLLSEIEIGLIPQSILSSSVKRTLINDIHAEVLRDEIY